MRRDFDDWTPPASVRKSWARKGELRTDSEDTMAEQKEKEGPHVAAGDRHGRPDVGLHQRQQNQAGSGHGNETNGTSNGTKLTTIDEKV